MGLSLIVMKTKILLSSGPGSFHSLTLPLGPDVCSKMDESWSATTKSLTGRMWRTHL